MHSCRRLFASGFRVAACWICLRAAAKCRQGLKDGDVSKLELNKNKQSEIKLNFDFQKSGFGLEMCHIIMCGAC